MNVNRTFAECTKLKKKKRTLSTPKAYYTTITQLIHNSVLLLHNLPLHRAEVHGPCSAEPPLPCDPTWKGRNVFGDLLIKQSA